MIDRILDKYYTKKLIKIIKVRIICNYNLDFKSEIDNKEVHILCKPRKHKDFTRIYSFYKTDALIELINFNFIYKETIKKTIEYLDKNNEWR